MEIILKTEQIRSSMNPNNIDNNYRYIKKNYKSSELNYQDLLKKVKKLSTEQQKQWSQIVARSCRQLYKQKNYKVLKAKLFRIIAVCNTLLISYQKNEVQEWIKDIAFQEKGQSAIKQFKEAGFNVDKWEVLEYSDPWYTRIFSFF